MVEGGSSMLHPLHGNVLLHTTYIGECEPSQAIDGRSIDCHSVGYRLAMVNQEKVACSTKQEIGGRSIRVCYPTVERNSLAKIRPSGQLLPEHIVVANALGRSRVDRKCRERIARLNIIQLRAVEQRYPRSKYRQPRCLGD